MDNKINVKTVETEDFSQQKKFHRHIFFPQKKKKKKYYFSQKWALQIKTWIDPRLFKSS